MCFDFVPESAYAQGYLAGVSRAVRRLPAKLPVRQCDGDPAGKWLAGYDDAVADGPAERTFMLETFLLS